MDDSSEAQLHIAYGNLDLPASGLRSCGRRISGHRRQLARMRRGHVRESMRHTCGEYPFHHPVALRYNTFSYPIYE